MMKTLRFFFVAALAMISMNVLADDVTWDLTKASYDNDANKDLVTWSNANVTMTLAKGTSTTNANNYLGGAGTNTHTRVYKNQVLTFTPASGISISSIQITATSTGDYVTNFKNATWTNGTAAADGKVITITPTTGSNAVSCVFGAATRAENIKVVYASDGDTRTATTVEFGEGYATRATCGKDESVTLPTCQVKADGTPIDATVEWSIEKKSGNDDLAGAAISGNTITIPNHSYGTLQVTASYKGDTQNKPSSKFYNLTVYKGYMNIAEFLVDYAKSNSEIDATGFPVSFWSLTANEGTITGYNDVTVTYVSGSYTYINDGANDLVLYGNNLGLKQGDVLTSNLGSGNVGAIYGTIQSYNGLLELVVAAAADIEFTKKSEGATVTPKTLDIANISDQKNMNAYLKVENAEYVKKSDDGKVFTFKVGTTEFNVRNQFNSNVSFEVGAKYTIEGMGAIYVKSGSDPVYQLYYVASEKTAESGIAAVKAAKADGAMFNLAGQQVAKGYKGLVIVNGKKVLK